MTEFTKDDIEHYRKQYALWTSRRQTTPEEIHLIARLRDALDEIERLQARVQELEQEQPRTDMDILIDLQRQLGQLKSENERIREALEEIANSAGIDGCGFTSGEGHANCVWKARKALKEVTK